MLFLFNDTAPTEIYTLSLHDRSSDRVTCGSDAGNSSGLPSVNSLPAAATRLTPRAVAAWSSTYSAKHSCGEDRKSTRLNSSHANISYAVFCLKKKLLVRSSCPVAESA